MIKFKRKNYTIPEGHYTGPKDLDKIPSAVSTIAKGALAGTGVGAVIGHFVDGTSTIDGALTGTKYGALSGLAAKFLLNYLHKPMKTIKYREVDKSIRRQFGIFQISGVTVGDKLDKRASLDEKFSFNDRNVTEYKINFTVNQNHINMYTFGLTKEELDRLSKSLDYHCKKYLGMDYTAKLINLKLNSYSVAITFTNYQMICEFILEVSKELQTKINILDNDAIVLPRLEKSEGEVEDQKEFSVSKINKHTLRKMLIGALPVFTFGLSSGDSTSSVQYMINSTLSEMSPSELTGVGVRSGDLDNKFLEAELKKLRYVEGFHYTVGETASPINISVTSGMFILTAVEGKAKELEKIIKNFTSITKSKGVWVFTHGINKISEFEVMLKRIMSKGFKPNVYDQKVKRFKLFSTKSDNRMLKEIADQLERLGILDIELDDKIPDDVISLTGNLNSLKIFLPDELEYAQYGITDWIRQELRLARTRVSYEGKFLSIEVRGSLTKAQYIKLIKFIVKEYRFCTLLTI